MLRTHVARTEDSDRDRSRAIAPRPYDLCWFKWTEADVVRLTELPAANSLAVFRSNIALADRNLTTLKKLPKLASVQFNAKQTDDAILGRLNELPRLISLRLDELGDSGTVTEQGWRAITSLPINDFALHTPRGSTADAPNWSPRCRT